MWRWMYPILLTFAFGVPARACDLALVLAVDVSGSVDETEYLIQMEGLGLALADPVISEALVVSEAAVTVIQWTGSARQRITIPWTRVTDFEIADDLAARVAADPRVWRNFSTAIGEALEVSMAAFEDVPDCTRKVIDVSGDGSSNEGIDPKTVHNALQSKDITVNALAIEAADKTLTRYFKDNLIVGPGAFAIRAADYREYPSRIRLKLLREITKQTAQLTPSPQ